MHVNTLTLTQADFPQSLKTIPSPPKELYIVGSIAALQKSVSLSVVGSRKVSPYGIHVTQALVSEVARAGVVIISGLALGVDSVAHRAALAAETPTIAVLPCGLDSVYPRSHQNLAKSIVDAGGALISEYPGSTPPLRQNFIARNRLVSGLGNALLITEAAEKSGTLHTASFALEQGRTVMVVPGNITNPGSQGTNNLLKAGAIPVTEAQDIFDELGVDPLVSTPLLGDTPAEAAVLALLAKGITDAHQLQMMSKLSPQAFNQCLTMLEISHKIRTLGNNNWTII